MAWNKLWAIRRYTTTSAPCLSARLKRMRRDFVPVLTWGCTDWHMRTEVIRCADSAITRMARIIRRDVRRPEETWLEWHVPGWRCTRASI